MIEFVKSIFQYDFMVRAISVGVLVSLCAALLGVSMVLKRYSMIGDGLSHVGFAAMAAAAVEVHVPVGIKELVHGGTGGRQQLLGLLVFHGRCLPCNGCFHYRGELVKCQGKCEKMFAISERMSSRIRL